MNESSFDANRFPWGWRVALAVFGVLPLALLMTAFCLSPDSRGYGTHQQLGLPECTVKAVFKKRCPSCGMTTSWAHLVRGRVIASFRANAGGSILAISAMIAGPWFLTSGLRGRWVVEPPREIWVVCYALGLVAVIIVEWVVRLCYPL